MQKTFLSFGVAAVLLMSGCGTSHSRTNSGPGAESSGTASREREASKPAGTNDQGVRPDQGWVGRDQQTSTSDRTKSANTEGNAERDRTDQSRAKKP